MNGKNKGHREREKGSEGSFQIQIVPGGFLVTQERHLEGAHSSGKRVVKKLCCADIDLLDCW